MRRGKNAFVLRRVIEEADRQGHRSETLVSIVRRIVDIHPTYNG